MRLQCQLRYCGIVPQCRSFYVCSINCERRQYDKSTGYRDSQRSLQTFAFGEAASIQYWAIMEKWLDLITKSFVYIADSAHEEPSRSLPRNHVYSAAIFARSTIKERVSDELPRDREQVCSAVLRTRSRSRQS